MKFILFVLLFYSFLILIGCEKDNIKISSISVVYPYFDGESEPQKFEIEEIEMV
jgi:hypothetical protein